MFNSVKTVVSENWTNRRRLIRLANYELKKQNSGTVLGFIWNFLNPALQIFVYWFVFAVGLRSSTMQNGYPYIIWMIAGIVPWFYISAAMNASTTSIYAYSSVLKRMKFPVAIVPVKTVVAQFISHLWSMLVLIAIMLAYGVRFNIINILLLLYYMLCSLCFLISYALVISSITVLFKDWQKILNSVLRLLFYISPVVWNTETLDKGLLKIIKLNPLYYLLDGYRNSLLYSDKLIGSVNDVVYFWCFTIILFLLGCRTHMKFRKYFIDMI